MGRRLGSLEVNSFVMVYLEGGGLLAGTVFGPDAIHVARKSSEMTVAVWEHAMHDGSDMLVLEAVVVDPRIDSAIPSVPTRHFLTGVVRVFFFRISTEEQEDLGRWIVEFGSDGLHIGRALAMRTLGSPEFA